MNLYSFVFVTFFVLPSLKTLATSLPFFKMFSNRLSISESRVFAYSLLAKKHTLDSSGGITVFKCRLHECT